jgi:hypothetical protein
MQWLYLICSRAYTFIKLTRLLLRVEVWYEDKALVGHSEANVPQHEKEKMPFVWDYELLHARVAL